MEQKRTKIICTISDHNCSVEFIRQLHMNGMDVVRINSAHSTLAGAQRITDNVRAVSDRIGILIDTKGPEIRLTPMAEGTGIDVKEGDVLEIRDGTDRYCTFNTLYTNSSRFVSDVPEGAGILIDDGSVELYVREKKEGRLICEVRNQGTIMGRKSVNVPGVSISLPALTDKDREFVRWAIGNDIDFIAHSFVRSKEDLVEIQSILDSARSHIKIIAKIENRQGIDNIDEIMTHSYGVMIARGDLGVEIPIEKIPSIQKNLILKCRLRKKPVIVATQMLHSMIENPRPTRAEVSDVANAIMQSTDAVMLSGETATGKYPIESVRTMCKIAIEAEESLPVPERFDPLNFARPIAGALAQSIASASLKLPIKAIIFDTWSGRTGRYLAEYRPKVPVYAMCYNSFTMRELALTYNVHGYPFELTGTKEGFVENSLRILLEDGKISKGDLVAFIGGSFNDESGATYMEFKYV